MVLTRRRVPSQCRSCQIRLVDTVKLFCDDSFEDWTPAIVAGSASSSSRRRSFSEPHFWELAFPTLPGRGARMVRTNTVVKEAWKRSHHIGQFWRAKVWQRLVWMCHARTNGRQQTWTGGALCKTCGAAVCVAGGPGVPLGMGGDPRPVHISAESATSIARSFYFVYLRGRHGSSCLSGVDTAPLHRDYTGLVVSSKPPHRQRRTTVCPTSTAATADRQPRETLLADVHVEHLRSVLHQL